MRKPAVFFLQTFPPPVEKLAGKRLCSWVKEKQTGLGAAASDAERKDIVHENTALCVLAESLDVELAGFFNQTVVTLNM